MSHDIRNKWPNAQEATLPLGDRLFWLSLVILVFAGGAWRIEHEMVNEDVPRFALARAKRGLPIDLTPTGSIAPRVK